MLLVMLVKFVYEIIFSIEDVGDVMVESCELLIEVLILMVIIFMLVVFNIVVVLLKFFFNIFVVIKMSICCFFLVLFVNSVELYL